MKEEWHGFGFNLLKIRYKYISSFFFSSEFDGLFNHVLLVRIWLGPCMWRLFRTTAGEEQEKAKKESLEMLRALEEHGLGDKKFFGGDKIGIADIAFGGVAHWLEVIEDLVGVKLIEAHIFPRLHAWTKNFKRVPIIKENLPDYSEMLLYLKRERDNFLASRRP